MTTLCPAGCTSQILWWWMMGDWCLCLSPNLDWGEPSNTSVYLTGRDCVQTQRARLPSNTANRITPQRRILFCEHSCVRSAWKCTDSQSNDNPGQQSLFKWQTVACQPDRLWFMPMQIIITGIEHMVSLSQSSYDPNHGLISFGLCNIKPCIFHWFISASVTLVRRGPNSANTRKSIRQDH